MWMSNLKQEKYEVRDRLMQATDAVAIWLTENGPKNALRWRWEINTGYAIYSYSCIERCILNLVNSCSLHPSRRRGLQQYRLNITHAGLTHTRCASILFCGEAMTNYE